MRPFASRFQGKCCFCSEKFPKGTEIVWNRSVKGQVAHYTCYTSNGETFPQQTKTEETQALNVTGETTVATSNQSGDLAGVIAAAVAPLVKIQKEEIAQLVLDVIETLDLGSGELPVQRVEIRNMDTGSIKDLGLQHKNFPELLAACNAKDRGRRLNVWLVGPAGTGKTTACENVAKALDLPFGFCGALKDTYSLFGVISPTTQTYRRTLFREIWEHGGVWLWDDFDGSLPDVCVESNAMLANGVCAFPDAVVPRHPDCVLILTANTWGVGSLSEYCGRFKQDAAFIDRFCQMEWPIDENLELATCPDTAWAKRVQAIRKKVATKGIKVLVTPRASYMGAALIAAGLPQEKVEAMTIRKAMTADQWEAVR